MARPAHSEAAGPVPPIPPLDQDGVLSWAEQLTTFLGEAFKVSGFSIQSGTLTLSGSSPLTVSNVNVTANSRIILMPTSSVPVGANGVIQKISTWTSLTAANPFIADEYMPVDGASTTATYTPVASGNSVLVVYIGGAWVYGNTSAFGLKLYYNGVASTQLTFFQNPHTNLINTVTGTAISTVGTTSGPTDPVRVQTVSVVGSPGLVVNTERTLAVIEFNNSGGGGITDVYVDTKTVANGSFNVNWTGTAASETYDYIIMHKEIRA
jgi:hypothetical protein